MNRRILAPAGGLCLLAALAAWTFTDSRPAFGPRAPPDRPRLALLTSLPLMFGETFGLEGGSPALSRLEQRYQVEPIAVTDPDSLEGRRLLLLAHPRAQPAEALVALDRWVRDGGRVLLLADPSLGWPSERPFGDRLRPPPGFADTGLLLRWGLTLLEPATRGPAEAGNERFKAATFAPGRLESRSCDLAGDGFVARCTIGKGRVTVIADADFLAVDADTGTGNLDLLLDELERLDSP